jgi:hypothetical protein
MSCMSIRGRVSIVSIGIEVRVVRIGRAAFLRFFVSVIFHRYLSVGHQSNKSNQSINCHRRPTVCISFISSAVPCAIPFLFRSVRSPAHSGICGLLSYQPFRYLSVGHQSNLSISKSMGASLVDLSIIIIGCNLYSLTLRVVLAIQQASPVI